MAEGATTTAGGVGARLSMVVMVAVGLVVCSAERADAACEAKSIAVDPTTVAPGEVLTVSGAAFGTDCNDTGESGPPLGRPVTGIELQLVVGGDRTDLARVDAACDYSFTVLVEVPGDTSAGPGEVVVPVPGGTATAPVEVLAATGETGGGLVPTTVVDAEAAAGPGCGTARPWVPWVGAAAVMGGVALYARHRHRPDPGPWF